jgi:large subunit ribosomal protein L14
MIFVETFVKIADNSGARVAQCIKVLTPISLKTSLAAVIGSFIIVTLKKVLPAKKVKKGSLYKGIVVRIKKIVNRVIGQISFDLNSIILLTKKEEPIGSRIIGILGKEVRELNQTKIISLSSGLL